MRTPGSFTWSLRRLWAGYLYPVLPFTERTELLIIAPREDKDGPGESAEGEGATLHILHGNADLTVSPKVM